MANVKFTGQKHKIFFGLTLILDFR